MIGDLAAFCTLVAAVLFAAATLPTLDASPFDTKFSEINNAKIAAAPLLYVANTSVPLDGCSGCILSRKQTGNFPTGVVLDDAGSTGWTGNGTCLGTEPP